MTETLEYGNESSRDFSITCVITNFARNILEGDWEQDVQRNMWT